MCSETSEAVGTTWEHAQLEFQKCLKIRITLIFGLLEEDKEHGGGGEVFFINYQGKKIERQW